MRLREPRKELPMRACDLIAVALGLGLLLLFAFTLKYGVSSPDECDYYTVPHRLLLGEKLIADEWNVAQLAYLLNVLPYWAYTRLTGGTAGLILFTRSLFIAVNALFYAFMYIKLRRFRLWGVFAAFSFSAVVLQTIFSVTYFTAAPMAVMAIGLILAVDPREKRVPVLLFAGVLVACAVLTEPYLIFGFALWFIAVAVCALRQKRNQPLPGLYDLLLRPRLFFWVTAGAVGVFVPFMLYMTLSGAFENLGGAFPYLFSGAEVGLLGTVLIKKTGEACLYFGVPFVLGLAASLIAAVVLRAKKSRDIKTKRIVFAAACVCLAGSCVYAGIRTLSSVQTAQWVAFSEFHGFGLLLFSPVPFLLCEKTDPRVFALWLMGAAFSLLVDASSAVILASGGGIVRTACILQLSAVLPELRRPAEKKEPDKKKKNAPPQQRGRADAVYRAVLAACLTAVLLWHGGYVLAETVYKPYEKLILHDPAPLDAVLTDGPMRGLVTTKETARVYADTLDDLDRIKAQANGAPVAVPALAPYTYLYLDLPYGTYSAWFEYYETERLAAFWALRPKQEPAYIYLPYYDKGLFAAYDEQTRQMMLDRLFEWAEGEVTEGKAGYIIRVTRLYAPDGIKA